MSFINWLKKLNPLKKKVNPKVTKEEIDSFTKIVLDKKNKKNQIKNKKYKPLNSYTIGDVEFKVGDKVICRSNEPHPLWVGKIVEFWDNKGKWSTATPRVRNIRTGKIWGVNGIMKPYSEELFKTLRNLKPLEQWNFLAPEEAQYTEDEMKRKEELFNRKQRFMSTKKIKGSLPK